MLTVYRRHLADCAQNTRGRHWKRCSCPIWVQGTLGGETIRRSLNLTSWEAAAERVRGWEASGTIGVVKIEIPTIRDAVRKYMADVEARQLAPESIKKLRHTTEKLLLGYCSAQGFCYLKQLDLDRLREFRATWKYSPIAARKRLENLRAFFRFCMQSGWIPTNPATLVKPPRAQHSPTLPFTADQDTFWDRGIFGRGNRKRIRALVLLLRYSGLRIMDAVCLQKSQIVGDRLFLYTQKTGTPVRLPLPPEVIQALADVPNTNADYYFWNGRSLRTSAVKIWERTLSRVFEMAAIENGHAHRFRDTFAVELLLAGVPIDQVSILLGHSSVKVTEKHYSPWVKARQDQLEQAVRKTWPQLASVSDPRAPEHPHSAPA
jgi:integrase/recombinase XerD